ncbi:MAG: hypothetical protein IJZ80_09410 [Clostridia bacterium]|nr:hypothetical protein [Clostridia bacterium]
MKKRLFAMLLSALLLANVSACVSAPNDEIESVTEEEKEESTYEEPSEENEETTVVEEFQTTQTNVSYQPNIPTLSLRELREKLDCYITTKSGDYLKYLMEKDADRIRVTHEEYSSPVFHITAIQGDTEYKTTITLSKGVRTPEIYSGFTSEQDGYIFIFHLEGYAVSPMDDIELACLLKTSDGGKTWSVTEYQDLRTSNNREYISAACFFTEQVGFFTARYYSSDHFGPRTFWTLDGGKTWTRMSRLPIPNVMAAFGLKGADFATEIVNAEWIDGSCLLTVRICTGHSYKINDSEYQTMYIQFSSTDLQSWTLVK